MKRRSKILAGSSVLSFLAVGGGGAALGLAYSGELFALLPVLSSIGISTIGPILIATTALFVSLSLVLSISFLRSRHLEKGVNKKEVDQENTMDLEKLNLAKIKVRNFSNEEKEEYFEKAIQNFDELAIKLIVRQKDLFKDIIHKYGNLVYYAAKIGGDDLVKHIKTLGVDLDEPFDLQYSAIYYAIRLGDTKALKCLIDNRADLTKIRFRLDGETIFASMTPLMLAASELHKESVALLLSREEVIANINTLDSYNRNTALIEVFKKNAKEEEKDAQYEITKLLLENGVDPTVENIESKTALSLAQKNNFEEKVISLLEDAEVKWKEKHKESYVDKMRKSNQSQDHHK